MPHTYGKTRPKRPPPRGPRLQPPARQALARGSASPGRAQARLGDLLQAAAPPTMAGRLRVAGPPRRGSRTVMT